MENLDKALDSATTYVLQTWQGVVRGGYSAPPGSPELKFDTVDKRNEYADSITLGENLDVPQAGYFERMIVATKPIANEIEFGKPAWDMKPMLLNGPKARLSKSGHVYNIIPFRHGVPGKSGANAHFQQMPKDIHQMARQLKPTISAGRHIVQYGGKLAGTEGKYPRQTKTVAMTGPHGSIRLAKYTHKTGIYEGMVRVESGYGKVRQSQYMTFRVVSDKSPMASWWHPGRAAQPHINFIVGHCKPVIEKMLTDAAHLDCLPMGEFAVGMNVVVG